MIQRLFSKYKWFSIFLLIILSVIDIRLNAQVNATNRQNNLQQFNPLTNNVVDVLPPLSVLLDSAVVHAPQVNYEQLHATRNKYEIRRAKLDWTQYFGIEVEGGWGEWLFNDYNEFARPLGFNLTQSYRWDYAGVFYIRLPFWAIVKRKNEVMIGKKEVEMTMALRDQRATEARQEVIRTYNAMIEAQNKMKISSEYQEYTRIQMLMADQQFANKEIEVAEYARLKEIQTRGAYDFEQYKSEFSMNYQLLEEITGIKFNLINELK
ncbi:MAG: TolC family protein [Bacteroidota bacterium]|nr:TolC family protein [Bacteroidota bacterium]